MTPEHILMRFFINLTPRQRDVLRLASEGLTNQQIAGELVIAPSVVAEHLTNIYEQLGTLELVGTHIRPNRYVLVRLFAGFFDRHPELERSG